MSEGSQLPPFKKLYQIFNLLVFGANGMGALLTFIFLTYISPLPQNNTRVITVQDYITLIVGTVFLFILGALLGRFGRKSYPHWYERLRAGESHEAIPDAVRRELLNFPIQVAVTSLGMWFLAGLLFGVGMAGSVRSFLAITLVGGPFTSVLAFFALDLFWRRMVPVFFPQGHLRTTRAFRLTVFVRLLIVFLLSSIYPLGLLVALSLDRARQIASASNPEALLNNMFLVQMFLLAISVISSTLLAFFASRAVIGPLAELEKAMARVERNDLDVRVPVLSNDEVGYLSERFNAMVAGLRRGELLRNLLNLYVSPEVAREALEHGAALGGQLVECTVLFSDIRSFTTLSERLGPVELIALLNRYMSRMVGVVVSQGGMVNRFGGDSLLAVFGTPLNPLPNPAVSGIQAALRMRAALAEFNRAELAAGGSQLQCGIAVASGRVVAGNVGGKERIEYTVIGDTVNLAARLQAMSSELHHDILLNEETYFQARDKIQLDAEKIPEVRVRGKNEPVIVYAL
ncbi:MAG: adenylate/guanylate cyclase domain-containing protein [Chloroflexi bacterium]|nr:MAG: adenylate/guanylate cyclase domain-containing protein [Chloroflexota bacterium]